MTNERGRSPEAEAAEVALDSAELPFRSFIVRLWVEGAGGRRSWRGHITDVASNERHYVRDLYAIPVIFAARLQAMGVRLGPLWRIRCWRLRRTTAPRTGSGRAANP